MNIGFAMSGSLCTFDAVFRAMETVAGKYDTTPILSRASCDIDSRFGTGQAHIDKVTEICGKSPLLSISEVEPIGPKKLLDALIVAPCTGNTLAKLANGIYDTPVTLAVKSHLRNQQPVLIGVSTNDALKSSAKNIGILMNYKNYFFIPLKQDDYEKKPFSVVCDFEKTYDAVVMALNGKQVQPIIH